MQHDRIITSLLLFCFPIIASQTVTKVELSKDNSVIVNQSGEISIINERCEEDQLFDFSLISGNCPTVCGARCPLDILSKSNFYIYNSNPDSFPLYNRNIDFQNDGFGTSSRHPDFETIQFFTIPLDDYPRYMVFKSTSDKYFLFIIDSLKISGDCPPEMPLCCTAYVIDKIYGKIIFQDNGLPYFEQAVNIKRNQISKRQHLNRDISHRVIDIHGRSVCNAANASGVRIITSDGNGSSNKRPTLKAVVDF